MKKIFNINLLLIALLVTGISITIASCKKSFLDRPVQGALNEQVLANTEGLYKLLVGAYASLDGINIGGGTWETSPDNWIYGSISGSDAHKGSDASDQPPINSIANWSVDPSNGFMNAHWNGRFEQISRANSVLRLLKNAEGVSDLDKKLFEGEARFLRGYAYFELKKMFNRLPWIDENTTEYRQPNTEDIWPQIEADFRYGYENLEGSSPQVARANKWAAGAFLAKSLLYQKKYNEAKTVFTDVINNGTNSQGVKYGLNNRFEDNFDPATKNNKESVFQVQMSVNDGAGDINNAYKGAMLNFPYGGPFGCCGFFQPSIDLANSYRTDASGLPYLDNYNDVLVKNDMGITSDEPFTPYTGTLDPRIDWTIGRRGLPYKDWGYHPGQAWIRDQNNGGPYSPMKNVFWKVTADQYWDKSSWAPGSAINVNIIRFADVLLMAAEAEAQTDNLPKALEYVNMVRTRAGTPESKVYRYVNPAVPEAGFSTTPAANYLVKPYPSFSSRDFALKAIYFERKLELAMEGHRFFDISRWGIAGDVMNKYYAYERQFTTDIAEGHFTPGKNEYFPIPLPQIDLSAIDGTPTLTQNPGY